MGVRCYRSPTPHKHFDLAAYTAFLTQMHCFLCMRRSPEGLDDVGGNGGASFMGVGLPDEGDSVFGHLCHYRLLRRPRKLDELRSSGYRGDPIF